MKVLNDVILQHIKKIVNEEHRSVSYYDFLNFEVGGKQYAPKYGTIRNEFSKLLKERKIELCYRSKISFYTLPGIKFGKDKIMTKYHMEEAISSDPLLRNHPVYKVLETAYFNKQAIHNLHMIFKIKGIYESLSNSKLINSDKEIGNKSIAFKIYFIEKYTIIVNVYTTDTVKVIIGCSENPITLDYSGIIHFTSILTRIEERLHNDINSYCKMSYILPSFMDWTIVLWHIGRDSLTEYSKEMFHCKWDLVEKISIRAYTKKLNNRKKIRGELQFNPEVSVKELILRILLNQQ